MKLNDVAVFVVFAKDLLWILCS